MGGGIIGAACAYELARSGASVTLLERDELAAGASGRNIGFFGLPWDPALDPMATSSLELYLEVTADPPVPVHFDREPIGTLAVAIDEDDAAMVRAEAEAAGRAGLRAERLDAAASMRKPSRRTRSSISTCSTAPTAPAVTDSRVAAGRPSPSRIRCISPSPTMSWFVE